jgi:2-keto-4-pentenoate hydratase/2-oxohepta-3-ene-1,7-dioic acid hydratase in catechol pathway
MTRLVTYRDGDKPTVGVLLDQQVIALHTIIDLIPALKPLHGRAFHDIGQLLEHDAWPAATTAAATLRTWRAQDGTHHRLAHAEQPWKKVHLFPPVLRPSKVIGVGMNYQSFITQLGEDPPSHPMLFHKTSSALTGHRQPIQIPPNTDQPVPEGELAVIIGRGGAFIAPDQAMSHVAGYTCANDVSARNLEFQTSQWTSGKMLPTFAPLGPALVSTDEIDDPQALQLRTILNGEMIQQGSTADMTFSVAELVAEISTLVMLEPGDVILTGTPSDLGALPEPVFLTPGDVIQVHIDGIGVLENPVHKRPPASH